MFVCLFVRFLFLRSFYNFYFLFCAPFFSCAWSFVANLFQLMYIFPSIFMSCRVQCSTARKRRVAFFFTKKKGNVLDYFMRLLFISLSAVLLCVLGLSVSPSVCPSFCHFFYYYYTNTQNNISKWIFNQLCKLWLLICCCCCCWPILIFIYIFSYALTKNSAVNSWSSLSFFFFINIFT